MQPALAPCCGREAQTAISPMRPVPLHVIERRQNLIVRDHAAADDEDLGAASGRHRLCRDGFGERLFQHADALEHRLFGDHQRRRDLDCAAAEADRA